MENFESLDELLPRLRDKGYHADFVTDNVCLYCGDLDIRLNPEAFQVDEVYLVREAPASLACVAVYAISAVTGVKGIWIAQQEDSRSTPLGHAIAGRIPT